MSIPKASKPHGSSSQSRKRTKPSRRTATTPTVSARSRKTKSSPSPAPENTLRLLERVLVIDSRSSLAWDVFSNWDFWAWHNLIVALNYGENTFATLKNRWGENVENIPLDLLATFLYHPGISDARELNMLRIDHNNLFACRKPEQ